MALEGLAAARLLIIDANKRSLNQLERSLEEAGATTIYRAGSHSEAIKAYHEARPDVILLDVGVPPDGGFELLAQLQKLTTRGEPHVPVIMLTDDGNPNAKKRALEAGVYDLLHKQHERTELMLRLRNVIQNQSLYRQVNRQKSVA